MPAKNEDDESSEQPPVTISKEPSMLKKEPAIIPGYQVINTYD
jgi:hypothetical protein